MVVLGNGCICCTVRGELVGALNQLWKRRQHYEVYSFQRVMIETTGLADPAPILQELLTHPMVKQDYQLVSVITCVDAVLGDKQLNQEIESLKQAAVADRIFLTKTDMADEPSKAALFERLRALNPIASIHDVQHEALDSAWFEATAPYDIRDKSLDVAKWLHAEKYRGVPVANENASLQPSRALDLRVTQRKASPHDERIQSFCLNYDTPVSWKNMLKALQMLIAMKGEHLLRVKGLVWVEGEEFPRVIHVVQHLIFENHRIEHHLSQLPVSTQLVFIVRDLDETFVRLTLNHFMGV
jgi:G3E family GTPase